MKASPFENTLFRELRDPEFAKAYLEDALSDSPEEFFTALRKYVQANGGVAEIAQKANLSREAMYRMLGDHGNPGFKSVNSIANASGLRIRIEVVGTETEEPDTVERELTPA